MKRKTQEIFVQEMKQLNPYTKVLGNYINSKEKIKVQCLKCKNIWYAQPSNLLNGNKCPKCYGTPQKTNKQFVQELKKLNNNIIALDQYVNAKTKIRFKCINCDNIWLATPNGILSGHRCPQCYGTPKKSSSEYLKQFKNANKTIKLISEYQNAKTKVNVECLKCGYKWEAIPSDFIRKDGKKTGCPKCAGNMKKTHEQFENELSLKNPKIIVLGKYKTTKTKMLVKCKDCGYEWKAVPQMLLFGQGCPKCASGFQTSFFEQCIFYLFKKIYGEDNVINRDTSNGFELDIYIPVVKLAIEPGGWHWHKEKLENDQNKYDLCKKRGIRLLTIYDDVDRKTEKIKFNGEYMLFHEDIGLNKNNLPLLKIVLEKILNYLDINYDISNNLIYEIKKKAELTSKRKNTYDFIEQLKLINDKVTIIGEYINNNTKIMTKCNKCNYVWKSLPTNLLRNHGCPKCGNSYKKTTEDYIKELLEINPNIEVLDDYKGAKEKIKVKCKICGYMWFPSAGNLLAGHGCPKARNHKK